MFKRKVGTDLNPCTDCRLHAVARAGASHLPCCMESQAPHCLGSETWQQQRLTSALAPRVTVPCSAALYVLVAEPKVSSYGTCVAVSACVLWAWVMVLYTVNVQYW